MRTAAVLATLSLACAACGGTQRPPISADLGPREVVTHYYDRLAHGDVDGAREVLTDDGAAQQNLLDGDFRNLSRIDHVTVGQPHQTVYPPYTDVVEITVNYDAEYKEILTQRSGHVTRFVLVGRRAGGPWRIFSIGSGP